MKPRRHKLPYGVPERARQIDNLLRLVPIDNWERLMQDPAIFVPLAWAVERSDVDIVRLLLFPFLPGSGKSRQN